MSEIKTIRGDQLPDDCVWEFDLSRFNLKIRYGLKPTYYYKSSRHKENYGYRFEDLEKCDKTIPDLIVTRQQKNKLGYLTENQLKKKSLKPLLGARKCAVYFWSKHDEGFHVYYHPMDTEYLASDNWLSKATLKKVYLLPDSWIKRLGECDKLTFHEVYKSPIYLYSRQRVEKFLADNAVEYSQWLDKRDKYVQIFEQNRDKIFYSRNIVKQQEEMCLKCASSCAFGGGLFCAVHPLGLEKDEIPCRDFVERQNENI